MSNSDRRLLTIRRYATRAWRGPFYVGKLEQPVATGTAILKVFEIIWKFAVFGFLAFAAFALLIIALHEFDENEYSERLEHEVGLLVQPNSPECAGDDRTMSVTFYNHSSKTISLVKFDVLVREIGRSTNLVKNSESFGEPYYTSDAIIKPRDSQTWCYSPPELQFHTTPLKAGYTGVVREVEEWSTSQ